MKLFMFIFLSVFNCLAIEQTNFMLSYGNVTYRRDTSIIGFGVAYRDPQGLVWSELIGDDYGQNIKSIDAQKKCNSLGGRLPTLKELNKLIKDFTDVQTGFYNPYAKNIAGFVFPDLMDALILERVSITEPVKINTNLGCDQYSYFYLDPLKGVIYKDSSYFGNCSDSEDSHDYYESNQSFRCVFIKNKGDF